MKHLSSVSRTPLVAEQASELSTLLPVIDFILSLSGAFTTAVAALITTVGTLAGGLGTAATSLSSVMGSLFSGVTSALESWNTEKNA